MHPSVESAAPGVCPVCNMELVPKRSLGSAEALSGAEQLAAANPVEIILGQVKTIKGEYTGRNELIKANGVITYDPRAIRTISTRISGRVENAIAAALFQPVKKGQVLAAIYSPELLEAQRNFLEAKKHKNNDFIESAKSRLSLLGLPADLLIQIERSGIPVETIPVVSPVDGYLINDPSMSSEVKKKSKEGMMAVEKSEESNKASAISIRNGDYVTNQQPLFYLLEKNRFQLEINIRENDGNKIKVGQSLSGITANGIKINGVINLIEPAGREDDLFQKARVYLTNTGLIIGTTVLAEIETVSEEGLWLTSSAVMDLGKKKIVFLKKENQFIPIEVITGNKSNGKIRILKGLTTSDEVSETAGFMVDSDALITTELSVDQNILSGSSHKQPGNASKDALMMDERSVQLAGIKTAPAVKSEISHRIQLNGKIVTDPETRSIISSRIPGRIESMVIREIGKPVTSGMTIANVHSPEIMTIISDLKMSVNQGEKGSSLATASRKKLLRYGFEDNQIAQWLKEEEIPVTIAIRAEVNGSVTNVNAQPGTDISEGSSLLTVENLSTLWVEAEVYPGEENFIQPGANVKVTVPGTDLVINGVNEQILPSYKEGTQLMIARVRIDNQQKLFRPGQVARIEINSPRKTEIAVPVTAVIYSSAGTIVFVQSAINTFEKRTISTGIQENGLVAVTEGLMPGELVVTEGAYLLESQVKLRPGKSGHDHHQ